MSAVDNTNDKFGHNRPFNTGLGIPIARQSDLYYRPRFT